MANLPFQKITFFLISTLAHRSSDPEFKKKNLKKKSEKKKRVGTEFIKKVRCSRGSLY